VSLNKLGDFLSRRGRAGDAEKALGYLERSLEIAEGLHAANPESAEAARDLMVSLERMAGAIGGRVGGAEKALKHQLRAVELARRLHQSNPKSAYFADTLVRAFYFAAQRANSAGQQQLVGKCLGGCHQVLHQMVAAGMQVEPDMMQLYRRLCEAGSGRSKA
jgi:hypothetical protein